MAVGTGGRYVATSTVSVRSILFQFRKAVTGPTDRIRPARCSAAFLGCLSLSLSLSETSSVRSTQFHPVRPLCTHLSLRAAAVHQSGVPTKIARDRPTDETPNVLRGSGGFSWTLAGQRTRPPFLSAYPVSCPRSFPI